MTCYMCEKPQTSMDHVPPRCLFPRPKDIGGEDLLKGKLITVPSCDDHNLQRSKDDEHLWYVLSMCESVKEAALPLADGRLKRAIKRNPSLLLRIMRDAKPATISDASGSFETLELTADGARLNSSLEKIGRGLYFHHFGRKWTDSIKMDIEFLTWKDERDQTVARRDLIELRSGYEHLFAAEKKTGENPEVFYYSAHSRNELGISALRLVFYGGAKVTMFFSVPSIGHSFISLTALSGELFQHCHLKPSKIRQSGGATSTRTNQEHYMSAAGTQLFGQLSNNRMGIVHCLAAFLWAI